MALRIREVGRLDVRRAGDLAEVAERRELLALVDEVVDDLGAQEARQDRDALVPQGGPTRGDDLRADRTVEVLDRVAVEIDEVGG